MESQFRDFDHIEVLFLQRNVNFKNIWISFFYIYKLSKDFSQVHNFDHKQVLSLGLSSPALLLHGLLQAPVPEDENQVALFSPLFLFPSFLFSFFSPSFFSLTRYATGSGRGRWEPISLFSFFVCFCFIFFFLFSFSIFSFFFLYYTVCYKLRSQEMRTR